MSYDFSTTTHAKWILAGEHSVLRGHPALVFPLLSCQLQLHYRQSETLKVTTVNEQERLDDANLHEILIKAAAQLNKSPQKLHGHFIFDNAIPIGAGLGASAALCVSIAHWLVWKQWLDSRHLLDFAQKLEDCFHGKSSGLDIIGASSNTGMLFKQGKTSALIQTWQPNWYLSYSGKPGITAEGVTNVQHLWQTQPKKAQDIDQQMNQAVKKAIKALHSRSLVKLQTAIELACDCFIQWDLITPTMHTHIKQLYQAGALAVKPTGSGNGGYVLSLWPSETIPPSELNVISLKSNR